MVWRAFNELSNCRPSGFGPCGLRFTDIESWLRVNGVEGIEEMQEIYQLILILDKVWLEHAVGKMKTSKENK